MESISSTEMRPRTTAIVWLCIILVIMVWMQKVGPQSTAVQSVKNPPVIGGSPHKGHVMQSLKKFSISFWTNSLVTCHLRQHDVHVTLYNADTTPYPTFSGLLKQNMDKTVTTVVWTKYVASGLEWVMLSVIQVDVDVTKLSPIDNRVSN